MGFLNTGEHGGLHITPQGHDFLKEKKTVHLRKPEDRRAARERLEKNAMTFDSEPDKALFTALKTLRMEIAREQNIPPYIVFHDKTLREMAIAKPASPEALMRVAGVGERKMQSYGEAFLRVIAGYG
jgi:ATP-dependent DNA helicase RecQ